MGSLAVSLLDYGAGNAKSVTHALHHLGSNVNVVADLASIDRSAPIVVPGVGSFAAAMDRLRTIRFGEWFNEHVRDGSTPYLGICLGMQILAANSDEAPGVEGLGLIQTDVVALQKLGERRTPRIGFDEVRFSSESPMAPFDGPADFYFCHGFGLPSTAPLVDAVSGSGDGIGVAVRRDNVWATQFHLEKSQTNGLAVLRRFLETFG